ncbi:hypothetical protein RND71_040277 [Anisodus tanguticus]|uniref:1-acylglycerol-3-phosphate O-acyltransferase n=1 Tax=Anisodus tanguticus TaxID=243964 RepID=A0AAE1UVJ0_9SOLA|nr:hypothetical protein RND71_040277 [Anisodus tanguticus]
MAIAAAVVIVPLGVLFFISGLVINLIQASCFVVVRPISKSTYRRINRIFAELLWLELVWIVDWWAAVKRFGCLGSSLAVMKKSSKLLPSGLQRLKDYPLPFWLALFVEGTRFTQAKLLAAQEYAASAGLPVPRNVLIPRTKCLDQSTLRNIYFVRTLKFDYILHFPPGFVTAVSHMRSFVPAIYDATICIPKSSPAPTMLRLFKGQPSVVHVHLKRHEMKDLPENDDAIAQWCREIFVAKDKLLDKHIAEDTFGEEKLQDIGRPVKSLVVVASWACILILGTIKFLQATALLSSWKGVAISAALVAVVTVLMQVLINFSKSERSTATKVAPAKEKNVNQPTGYEQDKTH